MKFVYTFIKKRYESIFYWDSVDSKTLAENLATDNISRAAFTLNLPRKPRRLARFCSAKFEKRQNQLKKKHALIFSD